MPFTFSHPAAILPFQLLFGRKVSLTALVAGSIVPDFEYFIRINHQSFYSHTLAGLFWVDLPAGILLCFAYHHLVRHALFAHAPAFLQKRMAPYQHIRWNRQFKARWPVITLCVFAGSLTHLVWDEVIHQSIPFIQSMADYPDYATFRIREVAYLLVWLLHTLIGGFLVLFGFWQLPSAEMPRGRQAFYPFWLCLLATAVVLFVFQFYHASIRIIDNIAIFGINAFLLSSIITSLLFSLRLRSGKKKVALAVKKEG